jgi:hypothetical protein
MPGVEIFPLKLPQAGDFLSPDDSHDHLSQAIYH